MKVASECMVFRSNLKEFVQRTKKRLLVELCTLVSSICFVFICFSLNWPNWVTVLVFLCVAYIALGILMYPKAKKAAASCQAEVSMTKVRFSIMGMKQEASFDEIVYVDPVLNKGRITEIRLTLTGGSTMRIVNLEQMDLLYEKIIDSIHQSKKM